jgi:hypothetical protein
MKAAWRGAERIFSVQLAITTCHVATTYAAITRAATLGRLAGDEKPFGDEAERLVE